MHTIEMFPKGMRERERERERERGGSSVLLYVLAMHTIEMFPKGMRERQREREGGGGVWVVCNTYIQAVVSCTHAHTHVMHVARCSYREIAVIPC